MELHDLPPARDPKGGSPKSPSPIPVREYTETVESNGSKLSAVIIGVLSGALLGALGMWFTALNERGVSRNDMEVYVNTTMGTEPKVTRKDMEEFVSLYSPYVKEKAGIDEHQANQDIRIGRVEGVQQDVLKRLDKLEAKP